MKDKQRMAIWFAVGVLAAQPFRAQTLASQAPTCQFQAAEPSGPQVEERPISLKRFAPNLLDDQKRVWLFPISLARGKHWAPTTAFLLGTAALVAVDPHDTPYFKRTQRFAGFNHAFSSLNTGLGESLLPAAFYLAGSLRRDNYAKGSALLAGESLADAQIVSEIMKNVDRRLRPRDIPLGGNFADTWFKAGGGILINRGGFPSGHAIGAFSVATVFARRYRNHRWMPWVAYGLAGVIGFSRVTLSAHFPSDVFAGAFLGYAITRYDVLRGP